MSSYSKLCHLSATLMPRLESQLIMFCWLFTAHLGIEIEYDPILSWVIFWVFTCQHQNKVINKIKRKEEKKCPKRQTPSNCMILLISDLSAISKLLRHFSVSPKLRKLHNFSSKTSNSVKSHDINFWERFSLFVPRFLIFVTHVHIFCFPLFISFYLPPW